MIFASGLSLLGPYRTEHSAWLPLPIGFHPAMFYLEFGSFILGGFESLAVRPTRPGLDEHTGSILQRRRSAPTPGGS